jgi:DNA-binding FrmR family transcriptional regulator
VNDQKAPSGPQLGRSDQQLLINHLHRIEGQLRGIQRMVEGPRECIEILQQISAVEAALARVRVDVFRVQVEETMGVSAARDDDDPRRALEEILDIVERFSALGKLSK